MERGGVRRNHAEQRLHEAAHRGHHLGEFVVGLSVEARVAANLADGFRAIVHAPEVVAVRHGRKGAVERQDFQAMAGQIQLADNFRAQQRNYVRTFREQEAGENLFGNRGSAQNVAAFEHQDFLSGFGQVRGIDQAVVPAADHDHVIVLRHAENSTIRKKPYCSGDRTFYLIPLSVARAVRCRHLSWFAARSQPNSMLDSPKYWKRVTCLRRNAAQNSALLEHPCPPEASVWYP